MNEPIRRDEHVHKDVEERRTVDPERERSNLVAYAAIKYTAIVIIVIAVLYFLAVFLIPALVRR